MNYQQKTSSHYCLVQNWHWQLPTVESVVVVQSTEPFAELNASWWKQRRLCKHSPCKVINCFLLYRSSLKETPPRPLDSPKCHKWMFITFSPPSTRLYAMKTQVSCPHKSHKTAGSLFTKLNFLRSSRWGEHRWAKCMVSNNSAKPNIIQDWWSLLWLLSVVTSHYHIREGRRPRRDARKRKNL